MLGTTETPGNGTLYVINSGKKFLSLMCSKDNCKFRQEFRVIFSPTLQFQYLIFNRNIYGCHCVASHKEQIDKQNTKKLF